MLGNSQVKNIARGSFDETLIDEGFVVLTLKNETDKVKTVERDIDSSHIQFHFCVKGSGAFQFNQGAYTLAIQ